MTEPQPLLRPDEAYHAQAIPLKRDRMSPLPPCATEYHDRCVAAFWSATAL
jgi:hypothetical protein